jgi:hypothetical protein
MFKKHLKAAKESKSDSELKIIEKCLQSRLEATVYACMEKHAWNERRPPKDHLHPPHKKY